MSLAELTPEEQHVLILRYGFDDGCFRLLDEVSARLGLRRDQGRAIRKLRHPRLIAQFSEANDPGT